jgi:NTE family protein
MDAYLEAEKLHNGTPLYVSAYPTASIRQDLVGIIRAELGLGENQHAEFFHVQAQPRDEQRKLLLASAAIPMLFAPQEINGKIYTDGGQGGWSTAQGNTPIQPLLDAGYKNILVTHLSDGSLWNRQKFPDATILEIRPRRSISRSKGSLGGAKDLLGFDRANIQSLIEQGYEDTLHCVGRVRDASNSRRLLDDAQQAVAKAEDALQGSEKAMRNAMNRLEHR